MLQSVVRAVMPAARAVSTTRMGSVRAMSRLLDTANLSSEQTEVKLCTYGRSLFHLPQYILGVLYVTVR